MTEKSRIAEEKTPRAIAEQLGESLDQGLELRGGGRETALDGAAPEEKDSATSESLITREQLLEFFWDKWKRQDSLAHERWTAFWATTGAAFGASTLLLAASFDKRMAVMASLVLVLAGLLGFFWKKVMGLDIRVRNTHNPELVALLKDAGYFKLVEVPNLHNPDSDHPVNHWHAIPRGHRRPPEKFRGSKVVREMMKWISILEIVVGGSGLILALWVM